MVERPILASFAQKGISPQRISTISRSPLSRFSRITGWKVCGATLKD
jgi:hypothetical protein